jgi:serine/threonine protein kinase
MLERGTIVAGDFRVDGVVGDGGMGVVYEATQLSLDRTVALKLVSTSFTQDLAFRERFRREGRLQATLEHAHVIDVYAAGTSEHGLYLAMRLVRGPSLAALIGKPSLTVERTVRLLTQIASALDAAHDVGLIHRDLKPHNILIDERRDHSYLADFGVTKARGTAGLTQVGQLVGTLAYMAPEQFKGYEATEQSDVYSFGAVLFESIVGTVPFAMPTEASIINAHLSEPVPKISAHRPELPPAVDDVIVRAMAKDPEDRYATATAMMEELAATLAAEAPVPTTLVSDVPEPPPSTATRIVSAPETVTPPPETRVATAAEQATTTPPEEPVTGATITSPVPPVETPEEAQTAATVAASAAPPATEAPAADADAAAPTSVPPTTVGIPPVAPTELRTAETAAQPVEATTVSHGDGAPPPIAPTAERAAPPPAAPARPRRAAGSKRIWAVGALVVVGLAVAGFIGGSRSAPEKQKTVVDQTQHDVKSGALTVSAPVSWKKATAPAIPGLKLGNDLNVAPSGSGGLTAGTARRAWPSFLPAPFRKAIGSAAVKRREIVTIGGLSAYRYNNVKPKGYKGSVTVYAIPQSKSEWIAACWGATAAPPSQCEDVAASLRAAGGKNYVLAPSASYAARVRGAVSSLDTARKRGLNALGKATSQKAQATAAKQVAAAYTTFVRKLRSAGPTPYARPAHDRIVSAANLTQRGYTALGNAATAGSSGRYNEARKLIRTREATLRAALNQLSQLGYRV